MTKKKDKNKIYFGLFIIFLMVSSSIGFMYSGDSSTKKINGHKFIQTNSGWETYLEPIESYWAFNYLPNEIDFDVNEIPLTNSEIYVYAEEKDKEYISKLKFILLYKGIIVNEASELNCDSNTWVINSDTSNIEISKDNNCIYLNGNINKLIDGLTYKIFGVI